MFDRLAAAVVSLTTLIMFAAVSWIAPRINDWPLPNTIGIYLVAALGSIVVYRTIAELAFLAFKNSLWLRKIALGRAFLEGTWVGRQDLNGQQRWTVEVIDQRSGVTRIRGRGIDGSGSTTMRWNSTSSAIDPEHMQLIYSYSCDILERSSNHQGIAAFTMRYEPKHRAPNILDGYAADLTDGKKDANREVKISDRELSDEKVLSEAQKHFSVAA